MEPGYYAASGMALVQSVDGLGEQAGVIGNTLLIKRGADVIEILTTPYDGSQKARAAMVALGKAIYPRFQSRRRRSARVLAEGERHAGG